MVCNGIFFSFAHHKQSYEKIDSWICITITEPTMRHLCNRRAAILHSSQPCYINLRVTLTSRTILYLYLRDDVEMKSN